jgi:tetratricopeptide (TPR) repeat protein
MTRAPLTIALLFLFVVPSLAAQSQGQQGQQQGQQQDQQGQPDKPPPPKQQPDGQKAQQQDQKQDQQQAGQDQSDSDDAPVSHESSSKKPHPENEKSGKDALPGQPPAVSSDAEKAKANANYNPFPAEQDIEVGMFYLHKGDVDAAIDRFLDAIQQRPNFAKPRLLLGKAYEKKHDNESAVKYYKEYLQVLPGAPDAKEVRKKIEKLSKE